PFLVGYTASIYNLESFSDWRFWVLLFYFLIPANILLYGVNDIADQDTDAFNTKKNNKEGKLVDYQKLAVYIALAVSGLFSVGVFFVLPVEVRTLFILFIVLSLGYSLPPIRLKAKPFLDFLSNVLYVLPGFIGFMIHQDVSPNMWVYLASAFWAFAMHLFSAIPDIEPDKKAGLLTTAVFLGHQKSLVLTLFLWTASFVFIAYSGVLGNFLYIYLIYPILPFLLLTRKNIDIGRVYWAYPFINGILGFLLFLVAWFS
ncbi:MAG: prenyltransferase, partial [Candidatus Paceibacteria bacterium]